MNVTPSPTDIYINDSEIRALMLALGVSVIIFNGLMLIGAVTVVSRVSRFVRRR